MIIKTALDLRSSTDSVTFLQSGICLAALLPHKAKKASRLHADATVETHLPAQAPTHPICRRSGSNAQDRTGPTATHLTLGITIHGWMLAYRLQQRTACLRARSRLALFLGTSFASCDFALWIAWSQYVTTASTLPFALLCCARISARPRRKHGLGPLSAGTASLRKYLQLSNRTLPPKFPARV
ncbi:Uncharacterized protein HZ326_9709 [Fusarium oxysporum f. sp. albedinis]|nr:Uncharacterized protein HZ326_9709 [Fusarium oxysporum f. sp. albedinis]